MSTKILIKEYANGNYQVWRGAKVLQPATKTWTAEDTGHPGNYFPKLDAAMEAAADVVEKEREVEIFDYDKLLIERAEQAEEAAREGERAG